MSASLVRTQARTPLFGSLLCLAAALLCWVAVFWPECRAAVTVWLASTAYGHCFLVIPIALYLAWDGADQLRGLYPRADPRFALLALPLPFAWFVAERLGIMEGRQIVAIAAFEVIALTLLGWTLFRALLGPLLYLFFLVPFGAFVTPLLQGFTAHFIDAGLTILGIPHFVTDMTIEIGAGTFYVAEACAGLRFLIASVAFGVFFALLNYTTAKRRLAFVAASILIPIIANGIRALGIVALGSALGSAEAAAADHVVYGWVFFSVVMLVLVAVGLPFREDPPPPVWRADPPPPRTRPWAAIAVLVLLAIGPAAAYALNSLAVPGRLNATPVFAAPSGCSIGPVSQPSPGIARAGMECGTTTWSITLRALPARATAAALSTARTELLGELDADDAITGPVSGAPGWRSIVSHDPSQVTGYTSWVQGHQAAGGLRQRLAQARDSLVGATHDPAILVLTASGGTDTTQGHLHDMEGQLAAFIAAQPELEQQVARLTKQD